MKKMKISPYLKGVKSTRLTATEVIMKETIDIVGFINKTLVKLAKELKFNEGEILLTLSSEANRLLNIHADSIRLGQRRANIYRYCHECGKVQILEDENQQELIKIYREIKNES